MQSISFITFAGLAPPEKINALFSYAVSMASLYRSNCAYMQQELSTVSITGYSFILLSKCHIPVLASRSASRLLQQPI
jgi:xanthine/uracil/vitamin C permease (AzgA family)